jgi:iron complex outermembrane receptor protein
MPDHRHVPARDAHRARTRFCARLAAPTLFATTFMAHAQPPTLTEDIFLAEPPPVLGATRLAQPLDESPAAITIIDRQMIEASGALTIPDVLRLVPGFQVGHVVGHQSTVTYHGLSDALARRMQVLVDGRSVYSPFFGGVFWDDLPLAIEDIDRIEVIRGPNGVTYGANSFSAVVNIITRHPLQDSGESARYVHGEADLRRLVARHAGGDGDFRYRITAWHQQDEGLESSRFPDDQKTTALTFRGDYRVNTRDSLDIQFGYAEGPRDKGDLADIEPPHVQDVDTNYQQLRWRRTLGAEEELLINFYRDFRRASETYVVPAPPLPLPATVSEDITTERYDLELQHTLRATRTVRLVWGAEARLDRVTGPGYFNTRETLDSELYRLFGNVEWHMAADWIANIGAMYEHNDITGGDVSPRLALNHHLTPDHTVRAAWSRAWRTPSLAEDRIDWRPCLDGTMVCDQLFKGTSTLTPERIDAYELGYLGTLVERTLTVDVKLYREEIRDAIADPHDPAFPDSFGNGANTFRNDGFADIYGWEAQLEWRPARGTRLYLAHAYAVQDGQGLQRTTPPTYLDTDLSTPQHTTSLLAIQELPRGFEASGAWYRQDNMLWLDQGGSDDETGVLVNLDLRLAWKYRTAGARGTIAVVGQNLLGSYFDYQNDVVLDRRYYLSLGLELP